MAYGFNDDKSKFDITGVLKFQRLLTSADDLNDISTPGIYVYATGNVPANSPFPNASVVEVLIDNTSNDLIQRATRVANKNTAFRGRYRSGGQRVWTAWFEVALKEDITGLSNQLNAVNSQVTTNKNNITNLTTKVNGIQSKGLAYPDFKSTPEWILNDVNLAKDSNRKVNITKKGYYHSNRRSLTVIGTVNGWLLCNDWGLPFLRTGEDELSGFYPLNAGDVIEVNNQSAMTCWLSVQYFKQQTI